MPDNALLTARADGRKPHKPTTPAPNKPGPFRAIFNLLERHKEWLDRIRDRLDAQQYAIDGLRDRLIDVAISGRTGPGDDRRVADLEQRVGQLEALSGITARASSPPPARPRDPTGAERARRYRARQRAKRDGRDAVTGAE